MTPRVVILMGVSGSGKTTIGEALATQLDWPFFDGDDYHPPENVAKMSKGIPLTDEDRTSWLMHLRKLVQKQLLSDGSAVLACSALKQRYRKLLAAGDKRVAFVHLKGDYPLILERLRSRVGHFMKPAMLQSQFETLEEPKDALVVDTNRPRDEIVTTIVQVFLSERSI